MTQADVHNADELLGRWLNTNHETRGISECTVARDGDGWSVSLVGVGEGGPIRWPTVRATPLTNVAEKEGGTTTQRPHSPLPPFLLSVASGVLRVVRFGGPPFEQRRSRMSKKRPGKERWRYSLLSISDSCAPKRTCDSIKACS